MSDILKSILDDEFSHVKFDTSICHKLIRLDVAFVNKNEEHAHFFGQGSIGVERVSFTSSNRDDFFIDTFGIDETDLQKKITQAAIDVQNQYNEKKKKDRSLTRPSFDPTFENSQDPFNICCLYVVYRIGITKNISKDLIYQAQLSTLNYLNYSFLTSLIRKYYPYPPDPDIARATFAALSAKYLIKQLGTWQALVKYRSESILSQEGTWLDVIKTFSNCDRTSQCINDIKGRMNSHVGEITTLFHQLHREGTKLNTDSHVYIHDGEKILKEADKGHSSYTNYILNVIPDKNDFIKGELVEAICSLLPTCSPKNLKEVLLWYSGNYSSLSIKHPLYGSIDNILEHAYGVILDDPKTFRKSKDLVGLLIRFKGIYTSSRNTDDKLNEIKETILNGVYKSTELTNFSRASAVRNAFMLYIVARTFCKSHYEVH
jgi:hypothetical protein